MCVHTQEDSSLFPGTVEVSSCRNYKMGQSATKEQKLHQEILQRILKEQGFAVSDTKLVKLLIWIRDHCSWYPSSGSYDNLLWAKVGEELQTKKDLQLEVPEEIVTTWETVYTPLNLLKPTETTYKRRLPLLSRKSRNRPSCSLLKYLVLHTMKPLTQHRECRG